MFQKLMKYLELMDQKILKLLLKRKKKKKYLKKKRYYVSRISKGKIVDQINNLMMQK